MVALHYVLCIPLLCTGTENQSPTFTTVVREEEEREQRDNLSHSRPGPVIAWKSDSEEEGSPPRAHQSRHKSRRLNCTLF